MKGTVMVPFFIVFLNKQESQIKKKILNNLLIIKDFFG